MPPLGRLRDGRAQVNTHARRGFGIDCERTGKMMDPRHPTGVVPHCYRFVNSWNRHADAWRRCLLGILFKYEFASYHGNLPCLPGATFGKPGLRLKSWLKFVLILVRTRFGQRTTVEGVVVRERYTHHIGSCPADQS